MGEWNRLRLRVGGEKKKKREELCVQREKERGRGRKIIRDF